MMLDKNYVLGWEQVEHDLYEEDGHVFGIELDLFNNHTSFYYARRIKSSPLADYYKSQTFEYLDDDIYKAINQFNERLRKGK